MKKVLLIVLCILICLVSVSYNPLKKNIQGAVKPEPPLTDKREQHDVCKNQDDEENVSSGEEETSDKSDLIASITARYANKTPNEWSETATGVKTELDTDDKVIALTFDACGGEYGSGYDKELIDFLIEERIPATLFINSRWIDKNSDIFVSLSGNDLFEIENHGTGHLPLSVNGKSAYNIAGTKDITAVIDEVEKNADKIYGITGRKPKFFRSGTAFYDEVAVQIVDELGESVAGYSVLGDAGATYSKEQVKNACLCAESGSIIICHMNHPEKETAEGIEEAVPILLEQGYSFVKLEDFTLK